MPTQGIPLSTYLEPHDAEALRECAKAADRSIAGEIRHAIRRHLNNESPAGTPSSRDNSGVETADYESP